MLSDRVPADSVNLPDPLTLPDSLPLPDSVTRVFLVRHGRSAHNAQGRLSGRHDTDLDDLGARQVRATAEVLRRVTQGTAPVVVSSPLVRCVRTAEAIADAVGGDETPSVQLDGRFVELDYGSWDGRLLSDVPADVWRRWREEPGFAPPGGETLESVTARVSEGLFEWVSRDPGGTIVIASHVSPIKAALTWALGVEDQVAWRLRLSNASITRLDVGSRSGVVSATVTAFNETAHLEDL